MRVRPNVLVADFWALTVYDVQTRAPIETPQHVAEINPNVRKLKANTDGSIDLFFGPTAPKGMGENWVENAPGRAWFPYFRWYGPTEAYYDKSWKLRDIEPIDRPFTQSETTKHSQRRLKSSDVRIGTWVQFAAAQQVGRCRSRY